MGWSEDCETGRAAADSVMGDGVAAIVAAARRLQGEGQLVGFATALAERLENISPPCDAPAERELTH